MILESLMRRGNDRNIFFLLYLQIQVRITFLKFGLLKQKFFGPVGWGCRIHQLHPGRGVRLSHSMSVLDMTLNNLMVKLQYCWSFGECGVFLCCHCSQVHSGPDRVLCMGQIELNCELMLN